MAAFVPYSLTVCRLLTGLVGLAAATANAQAPIRGEAAPLEDRQTAEEVTNHGCSLCRDPGPRTLFRWASDPFPAVDSDDADVIVTDRPDFTESSSTVGRGRLQVEAGYTFFHDDTAGVTVHEHTYPETLYRIGAFAEWFELRIGYTFVDLQTDDPVLGRHRDRGSDDLYLGAKLWLTEQAGPMPEMALIPQMLVPSGSKEFTNDEVLPGLNWVYSWELSDRVSIGGSTQVNRVRDESGHFYVETAQSATVGMGLTDRLGAYAEYFGLYPTSAIETGVGPEHFFNGGLTYLLTDDVQFDVRSGFGLNRNATDFFTGAGLSVRF